MSIPESIITGGGKRKHIFTRVVRDVIPDEIIRNCLSSETGLRTRL